jgi:hypothetical protein
VTSKQNLFLIGTASLLLNYERYSIIMMNLFVTMTAFIGILVMKKVESKTIAFGSKQFTNDKTRFQYESFIGLFYRIDAKYQPRFPWDLISCKYFNSDVMVNRRSAENHLLPSNDDLKPDRRHDEDHWLACHKNALPLSFADKLSQKRLLFSQDVNLNTDNRCASVTACELCTFEQRENESACKETGRVQRWNCHDTEGTY